MLTSDQENMDSRVKETWLRNLALIFMTFIMLHTLSLPYLQKWDSSVLVLRINTHGLTHTRQEHSLRWLELKETV